MTYNYRSEVLEAMASGKLSCSLAFCELRTIIAREESGKTVDQIVAENKAKSMANHEPSFDAFNADPIQQEFT